MLYKGSNRIATPPSITDVGLAPKYHASHCVVDVHTGLLGVPDSLSGEEIYKHLSVHGRITEIKLRPGFGFVQFEHRRDALEVVRAFSNQPFLGFAINVQLARPERYARSPELEYEPPSAPPAYHQQDRPKKMRYAVVVNGLDPRTCWQELKDFGRSVGGEVAFCDVDKDHRTRGWLNYAQEEDANRAVRELDGTRLLGNVVRLQRQYHKDGEYSPRTPRAEPSASASHPRHEHGQGQGGYRHSEGSRPSHRAQSEYHARELDRDTGGRDRAFSGSAAVRPYPHNTGGYPALFPDRTLPHEYAMGSHGHQPGQGNPTGWQFR